MMADVAREYRNHADHEEAGLCLATALHNDASRPACEAAAAMVAGGSRSPGTGKRGELETLWMRLCERP